jgi:hypothetical protein
LQPAPLSLPQRAAAADHAAVDHHMATGSEGGAYHEVGKFYRAILARSGVEVRLLPTGGSEENLALLRNPQSGVSVALVQSGNARENDANVIESLGTLFYEPLWLFYRSALRPLDIDSLQGLNVSVGPEGSGSRVVALELLKRSAPIARCRFASAHAAVAAELLSGEIDAALMQLSWIAGGRRLLADERSSWRASGMLMPMSRCSYLSKVTLPAGVADLARGTVRPRHRAGRGASQPGRAEGSQHGDPVSAAQHRSADSPGPGSSSKPAVPGGRSDRHSAQRRGLQFSNPAGRS